MDIINLEHARAKEKKKRADSEKNLSETGASYIKYRKE